MPVNSVPASKMSTPPCHSTSEVELADRETQTPEKYCASCDDCAVSSSSTADTDPVVNTQSDLSFVAFINNPTALPRPEVRLLRNTGPPLGQPLGLIDSPFLRFDTLLI